MSFISAMKTTSYVYGNLLMATYYKSLATMYMELEFELFKVEYCHYKYAIICLQYLSTLLAAI
jgi:hypothetical protein